MSTSDVEKDAAVQDYAHLTNDTVRSFSWDNVTVTVKDRTTKKPLDILSDVNGYVEAGEMLALMGPRYVIAVVSVDIDQSLKLHTVAPAKQRFLTY